MSTNRFNLKGDGKVKRSPIDNQIDLLKQHLPPEITKNNWIGEIKQDSWGNESGIRIMEIKNSVVRDAIVEGFKLRKYEYGDPLDTKLPLERTVKKPNGDINYEITIPYALLDKLTPDLAAVKPTETHEEISQLLVKLFKQWIPDKIADIKKEKIPLSLEVEYKQLQEKPSQLKSLADVSDMTRDISSFKEQVRNTKINNVVGLIKGSDDTAIATMLAALPAHIVESMQKSLQAPLKVSDNKEDTFEPPKFHG